MGVQGGLTTGYYSYQFANPETYLNFILSENGTKNVSYGQIFQDQLGYMILPFEINQSPPVKGVVFYRVWSIPGDPYGYIISMRLAKGLESIWRTHGNQAIAVALSIRCYKQLIVQDNSSSQNTTDKRVESEYNMQLGMEYAHDPATGENYWVNPSTDFNETGLYGPGYYKYVGNETKKLTNGRSDD